MLDFMTSIKLLLRDRVNLKLLRFKTILGKKMV
jgi:hypothetical protein